LQAAQIDRQIIKFCWVKSCRFDLEGRAGLAVRDDKDAGGVRCQRLALATIERDGIGRNDALQAAVYSISWFGPAHLAGALSFSNHWFTTNRSALGDALTASFLGQGYGARLEGGYRHAVLPAFAVTPYGAVQFQDSNTPTFSETDTTGGGLGLNFAAQKPTDVRTELRCEVGYFARR
jgi:outer membrane autotransporter protein